MEIVVSRVDELPSDIKPEILEASIREDFSPIQWLIADWLDGKNQFSLPGESFYEARTQGRLIGVCGINQDPYAESNTKAGRIRRLYVLPEFRRRGVGTKLIMRVVEDAHLHFPEINLRAYDKGSATFFEVVGFIRNDEDSNRTHWMAIEES